MNVKKSEWERINKELHEARAIANTIRYTVYARNADPVPCPEAERCSERAPITLRPQVRFFAEAIEEMIEAEEVDIPENYWRVFDNLLFRQEIWCEICDGIKGINFRDDRKARAVKIASRLMMLFDLWIREEVFDGIDLIEDIPNT
jgi:hypothetical protein